MDEIADAREELARAEAFGRSFDDDAAVSAARRAVALAEATSDPELREEALLAAARFETAAEERRRTIQARDAKHRENEVRAAGPDYDLDARPPGPTERGWRHWLGWGGGRVDRRDRADRRRAVTELAMR